MQQGTAPGCQLELGSPECSPGLVLLEVSPAWLAGILGDQLGH